MSSLARSIASAPRWTSPCATTTHGGRGQIRQAYREGQEDQLAALGLVLNAVVLWNTGYLDAAVARLRAEEC